MDMVSMHELQKYITSGSFGLGSWSIKYMTLIICESSL